MKYELLKPEDFAQLLPVFEKLGAAIPAFGKVAIATDDNRIAGFLCLQPAFHVEPLWIADDYRGRVNPKALHDELLTVLPKGTPYYAFVPSRNIAMVTGMCGLHKLDWSIWKGES